MTRPIPAPLSALIASVHCSVLWQLHLDPMNITRSAVEACAFRYKKRIVGSRVPLESLVPNFVIDDDRLPLLMRVHDELAAEEVFQPFVAILTAFSRESASIRRGVFSTSLEVFRALSEKLEGRFFRAKKIIFDVMMDEWID